VRPGQRIQLVAPHPAELRVLARSRHTAVERGGVDVEHHPPTVHEGLAPPEPVADPRAHPQLLEELPRERRPTRLAGAHLAARELPQPGEASPRPAPRHETTLAVDQRSADDVDVLRHRHLELLRGARDPRPGGSPEESLTPTG